MTWMSPFFFGLGFVTYLGAVNPCGWAETKTVPHGVDEYENDANAIRDFVRVPWEHERQQPIDLPIIIVSRRLQHSCLVLAWIGS